MKMTRPNVRNGRYYDPDVGPIAKLAYDPVIRKHIQQFPKEKFIRGPIPFEWMRTANDLPGKTGQVGVALWFMAGVKKSKTFKFSSEALALSGCSRQTLYRALSSLEAAGLILVVRNPGQYPIITILAKDGEVES